MTAATLELPFTPGAADGFIKLLWFSVPPPPVGPVVGILHLVGDRGQILIQLSDPDVRQLVIRPGQVLRAADPTNPRTWQVVDPPDTTHLRMPQ